MLENFIYAKTKDLFIKELEAGNVADEAIVFIEDTKEIWNHGTYFDCNPEHLTETDLTNYVSENLSQVARSGSYNDLQNKPVVASTTTSGLMSNADKTKLDNIKVYRKQYRSLSPAGHHWFLLAEIGDWESSIFQISTNGHSDVLFAAATGWEGDTTGTLTILNTFIGTNNNYAHIRGVRMRKESGSGAKARIEIELNGPIVNYDPYVDIIVAVYTSSDTGNPLKDTLNNVPSAAANTIIQSYELKHRTLLSEKIEVKNIDTETINGRALANVASTGSYNDLTNKPTIPASVTETTISGWGFTKNTGTISEIQINGTTVATEGVVNIPVVTAQKAGVMTSADKSLLDTTSQNLQTEIARAQKAEDDLKQQFSDLIGESPETLDTIHEISSWILNDESGAAAMSKQISENKVAINTETERASYVETEIENELQYQTERIDKIEPLVTENGLAIIDLQHIVQDNDAAYKDAFQDLGDDIANEIIRAEKAETFLTPTPNTYWRLEAVGKTSSLNSDTGYKSIIVPVREGDKFIITAEGDGYARTWGTLDENKVVLRYSDTYPQTNVEVIIQAGECYLVVNCETRILWDVRITSTAADILQQFIAVQDRATEQATEKGRQLALRDLFVAAGALYNDTNVSKTRTAPWGESVQHLAGHYYLNGLGDITEEQMLAIYSERKNLLYAYAYATSSVLNCRTLITNRVGQTNMSMASSLVYLFGGRKDVEVIGDSSTPVIYLTSGGSLASAWSGCANLRHISSKCIYVQNANLTNAFKGCTSLETVYLRRISTSVSFADSPNLSKNSLLFMIGETRATSAITITLHANAYARLENDTEIVAALNEKNGYIDEEGNEIAGTLPDGASINLVSA